MIRETFDVEFARQHFSPLRNGWAMFENAGGSFVPDSVHRRVSAYMSEVQIQPAWPFAPAKDAYDRIKAGREVAAALINADPYEVVLGPSTTMNVYMLSQAIADWFKPGDEIIVSQQDHEANIGAWRRLAAARNLTIKEWTVDPDSGQLDIEVLKKLLTDRTRLVCITHCSNIIATVHDIPAIAKLAHDAGAYICVDGVAYAPHFAVDVKALDVDFYLVSLYKVFGPHQAILYVRRDLMDRAQSLNHFFLDARDTSYKLMPGGPNHEFTASLVGLGDYYDALYTHHFGAGGNDLRSRIVGGYRLAARHEEELAERILSFLRDKPDVKIYGLQKAADGKRAPTIAFTVKGKKSADIATSLQAQKIAMGNGTFWAHRCVQALGLDPEDGVVRAGIAHYNNDADVDRLLTGLDKVLG